MNYVIICGSQRLNSQSLKVSKYLKQQIELKNTQSKADIVDLGTNPLPLWNEDFWKGTPAWKNVWNPISKILKEANALIIVSPEYAGMVPGGLKNFFLFPNINEIGHKPALIVAVSAGLGGSYPVSELRTSSYKNNKLCYIPDHLIIRKVNDILNGEDQVENDSDTYYKERIDFSLASLKLYAEAMKPLMKSEFLKEKKFKNGM